MKRFLWVFCLILGFASLSHSTEDAIQSWRQFYNDIRVEEDDLKLNQPFNLPLTIDDVDHFYQNPLDMPRASQRWLKYVDNHSNSSSFAQLTYDILIATKPISINRVASKPLPISSEISGPLKDSIKKLLADISYAISPLHKAVHSISADDRRGFLEVMDVPMDASGTIEQEISARKIKKKYAAMERYKEEKMLEAGFIVMSAVDKFLSHNIAEKISKNEKSLIQWETKLGNVLIGGSNDNNYSADEIESAFLIIDLGGNNTYDGAVAAAHENEIKILIDYGENITIESNKFPYGNAGSGLFGIGLIYLPNSKGIKKLNSGSFSLGCGIAGIGGLFIKGETHLNGGRHVQGSAAFGLGVLKTEASHKSTFKALRYSQGAGGVRGIGILSHQGDDTQIIGGLVQPDPREPLGSVSLCQGVGYGRRAYSGGGIGIALLKGNRLYVEGSYFSQGVGYWNSLGIFKAEGDESHIQARRYDQGTGVHYAFGFFELAGNKNRLLNWGVGPAYGWDRSLGVAFFSGDENEIQADWGMGTASIGSLSFSYLNGNNTKLKIPEWGSSQFYRNQTAYSIHVVKGQGHHQHWGKDSKKPLNNLVTSNRPWGVASFENTVMHKKLELVPPQWRKLDRKKTIERQMADLKSIIRHAEEKGSSQNKVADILDVASAFTVDKDTPRYALGLLMELPPEEIPQLIEVLEPAAVDQLIRLRMAVVAHGETTTHQIIEKMDDYPEAKKLILMGYLGLLRAHHVINPLMKKLDSPQIRERLTATRSIGQIYNKDTGKEPGVRAGLTQIHQYLSQRRPPKKPKELIDLLSRIRLYDAFGILSQALHSTNDERLALLHAGPEDISELLRENGAIALIDILKTRKGEALQRLNTDIEFLSQKENDVRQALFQLLKSTHNSEVRMATIALGQISHPEDAKRIEPMLKHAKAAVREAATAALGRMGDAGLSVLLESFQNGDERTRGHIATAIYHATTRDAKKLVELGLQDPSPVIRIICINAIRNPPPVLKTMQKKLIRLAKRRLKREEDQNVLFALSRL